MNNMKKIFYAIIASSLLYSCETDFSETNSDVLSLLPKYPETEIVIGNHNYVNNMALEGLYNDSQATTRTVTTRDSIWSQGFGKTVKVQSDESIVMPHLQRYIYPGSLLQGNSIVDMNYKPITTAQIKPITVSVSFSANNISATIEHPSLSATRQFISDVVRQNGVGEQRSSFEYTVNRFTSYHELKVAFGSNVNTGALFWKSSSSTSSEEHKISKNTGLYVKFVERNFTLDMDLPQGSIIEGSLSQEETGGYSPVYVSSITYGRIGILTIETNESSDYASSVINEAFQKIFVSKSSSLTSEEKRILNSAEMKVYLIGGSGDANVQSVSGYQGFIDCLSGGGTFSADNPGVPIYCSYAYLSDNSLVKTNFKFDVSIDPLYVRLNFKNSHTLKEDNKEVNAFDVYLEFFSNPTGTAPTVPPSFVKYYLCKQELKSWEYIEYDVVKEDWVKVQSSEDYYLQNFYNETSMLVAKDFVPLKTISFWSEERCDNPYDRPCPYSMKREERLRAYTFQYKKEFYQTIPPVKTFDFHRGRMDSRLMENGYWRP